MKTTIYLINTIASRTLNAFCEKNADRYSFEAVPMAKQSMLNVMFASYFFTDEVKSAIARRIKFQAFRPSTNYKCMFLNLKTNEVVTFHDTEELKVYDIKCKTQQANASFDKLSKLVQDETIEWLGLASHLTHGAIDLHAWKTNRQACLDKMNLYLSNFDFDAYNAGHLEPRMKSNIHIFKEDYKFFDLQFSKNDVTQHEEERETEQYVVTDLETLKNFCHVLTCRRYDIDFNDSVGNGGRVTREACQGIINYTELAELIKQSPDAQDYILGLQDGSYTVEDVYNMLLNPVEDTESISYREF